jgi:hypothetical protein
VVWEDKDKAVPSTTPVSDKEYNVNDGKITVPVNITNTKYGYRVYVTPIIPQAPYKDVAAAIPGKIEVENYDVGGSGKSFLDKDDDNKGGEYREDAVDIVKGGSGYAIGYTQEGEWLEYTVKVAEAGEYGLSVSYATSSENTGVKLYVDDKVIKDDVVFPQGADWETYSTYDAGKVNLDAGDHVLKLEIVGNYVNIDWLELCNADKCGVSDSTGDSTTVIGNRPTLLGSPGVSNYNVFDMQGRLIARFSDTELVNIQAKMTALVKRPGSYLVKPQEGGRIFRIVIK